MAEQIDVILQSHVTKYIFCKGNSVSCTSCGIVVNEKLRNLLLLTLVVDSCKKQTKNPHLGKILTSIQDERGAWNRDPGNQPLTKPRKASQGRRQVLLGVSQSDRARTSGTGI